MQSLSGWFVPPKCCILTPSGSGGASLGASLALAVVQCPVSPHCCDCSRCCTVTHGLCMLQEECGDAGAAVALQEALSSNSNFADKALQVQHA